MAQDDVPKTTTELPIVEVTVQEDRALVRREGTIVAPPGRARLRIEGVAPVLVDKSLTAELLGDAAGNGSGDVTVRSVVASRWHVTEEAQRPTALAELQARLRQLQADHQALSRRRAHVASEREMVEQLLRSTLVELGEDAGWGRTDAAHLHSTLDALHERLQALGVQRRELDAEHERLQRSIADLQLLEAASHTAAARTAAALELELHNPGDVARSVRLRVDYLVPGALWRPWHRARLVEPPEGGARIELRCEGCVWQATGEDWSDVQLVFSTERPSLGLVPPVLLSDVLAVRKKGPVVEAQARQEQIHTAGLGADEGGLQAAPELPGIDDGGEAQRLRGRGRSSIPGDGRPYRVPLFDVTGPAEVELRCVPELAPVVLLRSEQTNSAPYPLLAGPVDLVRRSGLVGRTSLLFVAPGERFELGWGPDNGLRVTREHEEQAWERKSLSSWTRKPRRVRIKLSSLDATPRSLQVRERIAVSELDKVKVELQSATPSAKPDADGIVRWDVRLPGFGRQELVLEWDLVVHDDVQGV